MKRLLFLTVAAMIFFALQGCEGEPQVEHPIRNADNKFVTIETNYGSFTVELYRDVAPNHADSFYARAEEGFYDSTIFHRILKGFMMQGGDPTGTGTGGAGYRLDAEFSDLKHTKGTLSMARSRDPNSASSQFFVMFGDSPHLDNQYSIFGHVVNGYATIDTIEQVEVTRSPTGEPSKPVETVMLEKAYPSDAEGNPL